MLYPQLDNVEQNEKELVLTLTMVKELYYFLGHFPQAPLLAGVVQVHFALHYIAEYFQVEIKDYRAINALKFQLIIEPEQQIKLTIKQLASHKFQFSYTSIRGKHSSGKVTYAS